MEYSDNRSLDNNSSTVSELTEAEYFGVACNKKCFPIKMYCKCFQTLLKRKVDNALMIFVQMRPKSLSIYRHEVQSHQ